MDAAKQQEAKRRIRELARAEGIGAVGFTDAAPLEETRRHLAEAIAAGYIPAGSIPSEKTLERIVDPGRRLKTARTVVTACLSYNTGETPPGDAGMGIIAPYTRANFYGEIKSRLANVASAMGEEFGATSKVSSNYVSLAEKPLAARSGLGFYGKNGIIINPGYGSFIVLGEIVTDLEIEPDPPLDMDCGECTACIRACPTGAIEKPGWVNRKKCIQYISERRGSIPHQIRDVWGNRLYGCSTCQDVCPFNRDIPAAAPEAPSAHVGGAVPLAEVIGMGEADFTRKFEGNQIGMRDANAIRRNAIVAAGNSGARALAGPLTACLNDLDPMIRGHAAWALAALTGGDARPALESLLKSEWEPEARKETQTALDATARFF
ncbi:MAG: tRNA epoxyqueuosine(34) reductase QueG [bacterium]|jgi:epoxyqueuosine reductase